MRLFIFEAIVLKLSKKGIVLICFIEIISILACCEA